MASTTSNNGTVELWEDDAGGLALVARDHNGKATELWHDFDWPTDSSFAGDAAALLEGDTRQWNLQTHIVDDVDNVEAPGRPVAEYVPGEGVRVFGHLGRAAEQYLGADGIEPEEDA